MAYLIVILSFIVVFVLIDKINEHSKERMKIEAALREEEMRRGYMPGTFSRSFSSKKAYKEMMKEAKRSAKHASSAEDMKYQGPHDDLMDKEDLEKAISDLEERINNLDTIMREKKNGKI